MKSNVTAESSLVFYGGKNFADGTSGQHDAPHGEVGTIATTSSDWVYQSVAVNNIHAFAWSNVDTANTATSYLSHVEDVISASISDLTLLYSSAQFPLQYLSVDPSLASVVWLALDASQSPPNAVASTSLVGGSSSSVTTLTLPGRNGALAFVSTVSGSAVVANCNYGNYNTSSGTVEWTGTGSIVLENLNGAVTLLSASGFPDGWEFSAPAMQSDGSWKITLTSSASDSYKLNGLVSDVDSIADDSIDTATLTASVIDATTLAAAPGVDVTWSTTWGQLGSSLSTSDSAGNAFMTLTGADVGTAVVTATVGSSSLNYSIEITDSTSQQLTLFSEIDFSGNSTILADGNSVILCSGQNIWSWKSVKCSNEHFFSHAYILDKDTFDYRTYADHYDVIDVANIPAEYSAITATSIVEGTALSEDQVVIHVTLVPTDTTSPAVAVALQSQPTGLTSQFLATYASNSGVLMVLDKTKGAVSFPMYVGQVDAATGLATWVAKTTLIATWDAASGLPEVVLGADAPTGWLLYPAESLGADGEFLCIMGGVNTNPADVYYVSGAPALTQLEADDSYITTNKIVIHGNAGDTVTSTLSGSALFAASGSNQLTVTLDSSNPLTVYITDNLVEAVTVTTTVNGIEKDSGTIAFVDFPFENDMRMIANKGAPADGVSVNSVYFDSRNIKQDQIEVSLSGSAVFAGTFLQTMTIDLASEPNDATFDITNTIAEEVVITAKVNHNPDISCTSLFVNLK